MREVQLGLQALSHGRPLPHAGGDPQLGTRVRVDVICQALDHVGRLAGGPHDLVAERLEPVLAQPQPLVVLRAMGRPIAMHRGRDMIGENVLNCGRDRCSWRAKMSNRSTD